MLEFACPKCSESVRAAEDQAGEPIICPKCNETIRVPGSSQKPAKTGADDWSVFDDDEKFIEESVARKPDVNYRTPEDEREAVEDNDDLAAKQEELEERAAAAEALGKNKSQDFEGLFSGATDLTVDEQIKQEGKFQAELEALPDDSPLKQKKSWDRESRDTPDSIQLENQPSTGNSIGVKCKVCESVTLVSEIKSGSRIVCSDCGSTIEVPSKSEEQAEKARQQPEWEKWAQQEKSDGEQKTKSKIVDELFVEAPDDQSEGYGLAPAPEDMLTPVAPAYELTEVEAIDSHAPAEKMPVHEIPAETDPVDEERSELETSKLFKEMQEEKNSAKFELLPWPQHILGILSDPGFLIRVFASVAVMAVGYSIFHFSAGLAEMDGDRMAKIVSFLGKFAQIWSFPFLPISFVMVCWVGQNILSSTIVGDRKLPDLEGTSLIEWISSTLFVAVGLAIGFMPGALFGGLLWTQFEEWQGFWAVPALATISGMLVAPIIILSSLQNKSPFMIFSQKISDSIRNNSDAWIEFYLPCLGLAVVTGSLWLLGMTEFWIVVVFMLVLVNLCFGLYFRMLGRLMGRIVNKSAKKKKTAVENGES